MSRLNSMSHTWISVIPLSYLIIKMIEMCVIVSFIKSMILYRWLIVITIHWHMHVVYILHTYTHTNTLDWKSRVEVKADNSFVFYLYLNSGTRSCERARERTSEESEAKAFLCSVTMTRDHNCRYLFTYLWNNLLNCFSGQENANASR